MSVRVESAAQTRQTLLDRALGAYPVAVLYLVLSFLYAWQSSKVVSPFVFSDELKWAELSRGIAATGHAQLRLQAVSPGSLYAYFIAPAWWLGPTGRAYAAVKYFGALTMAASIFPAYLLARTVVSRPLALFAAAGAASVPALVYSSLIIPEPLAYTYSALCIYALARALVRRTLRWILVALILILAAPAVRSQLAVLGAASAVALLVYVASSDRGRRVLGSWSTPERLGAGLLALGAAIFVNAYLTHHSYSWQVGTHYNGRMIEYGTWAAGAFVIGVGVFPAVAALGWIVTADQRRAQERALLGVAVGAIVAFGLYTAVKASYISTNFATRVEERNLIYLSPVVFACAAAWMARLRVHLAAAAVATAAVVAVVVATPYQLADRLYSDAPGLAILSAANRHWAWNQDYAQNVLLWMVGLSAALLVVPEALRRFFPAVLAREMPVRVVLGTVAAGTLAWTLTAELTAASGAAAFSRSTIGGMPKPPDWIDAQTDRQRAVYIGQRINGDVLYPLEFWNQSIGEVWSLDASTPPPGPSRTPNLNKPDGTLDPQLAVKWAVGDNGVALVGRRIETHGSTTLFRITPPLRITSALSGVYDDGWMVHDAWFAVYSSPGNRAGVARITVSRAGATGREPRSRVTVRIGTVGINQYSQPKIATVLATRRFTIGGREVHLLELPARPPYRVEVHVARTYQPTDFGLPDGRELGAQVAQAFVPRTHREPPKALSATP
jgi:hypothetical protein